MVNHSRQLQGCAVICHGHQVHAYKNKYDFVFAQNKKPPIFKDDAKKVPPIIEEGKMNMCVSLIMECPNLNISRDIEVKAFEETLKSLAYQQHLAGGTINKIQSVQIFSEKNTEEKNQKLLRIIKKLLLPGFVLIDRSDLLAQYHLEKQKEQPEVDLIDTWLDFCTLKYKADPLLKDGELEPNEKTKAKWEMMTNPEKGFLVPITNGYKAITQVYNKGIVANTRNPEYPFCFVEASHSIGEWRSLHRIEQITHILWQYHYEQDWYLCQQRCQANSSLPKTDDMKDI